MINWCCCVLNGNLELAAAAEGDMPSMKHVRTISRVNVSRAQMPTEDIISIVISVLTALGSLLGVVIPLFGDKQK